MSLRSLLTMNSSTIQEFQSFIRKRWAINRRDLPRRKTTDPYKIWISETMLCQTQVNRVISYYNNRIRQFPTVEDLAQASVTQVLQARSGLGYNSRGVRLRLAAQAIVQWKHDTGQDNFPCTYNDLIALPGVGDYVASAILAFAYQQDVAVIDTNIRRILIHHFQLDPHISLQKLKAIALQVLPQGHASDWYNALMDYGALELTAKKSGIRPLSRQSTFEGSRRQVRAWIIKSIINHPKQELTLTEITTRFPNRDDHQSIIEELIQENLILATSQGRSIKN